MHADEKAADVTVFFSIVISDMNTVFCMVTCFFGLTFPELLSINRFFIIFRKTHESVHKRWRRRQGPGISSTGHVGLTES